MKNNTGFRCSQNARNRFQLDEMGNEKVIPAAKARIKDGSIKGKGVV
jgi:hypothetical protein